jgi:hypothetical protein
MGFRNGCRTVAISYYIMVHISVSPSDTDAKQMDSKLSEGKHTFLPRFKG